MNKKLKIFFIVLGLIAIGVICTFLLTHYANRLFNEGTVEPESETVQAATQIPSDNNGVVSYLSRLVAGANDSSVVATDVKTELSIEDDSIICNGSESELGVLKYLKGEILGTVSGYYPSHDGTFEDGFAAYPAVTVPGAQAVTAECVDGSEDEKGEITDDGFYYIDVLFGGAQYPVDSASPLFTTFNLKESDGILAEIKEQTASMLTVNSAEIAFDSFAIEARADKEKDQLDYISFIRTCSVTLRVTFDGEYAGLGISEISFVYTVKETYDYTWAGISFTSDRVMLYKGEKNILGVAAVVADDASAEDYEIAFESSDPSIASVNNEGDIEGIKISPEPITVTVTFKYCGHTYTDSCLAYVTVAVEGVEVTPEKAAIMTGDTLALSYTVRPDDATITSAKWFTEDSSVATVDENGVVTAVGAGSTKVYAVTDDGYFRSSCHITVEG